MLAGLEFVGESGVGRGSGERVKLGGAMTNISGAPEHISKNRLFNSAMGAAAQNRLSM